MIGTDTSGPRPAIVLRRVAAVLLALVAIPLFVLGATALASPDYFDLAALGTAHFFGSLALSFAVIAFLAAISAIRGRSAFRNLGCAGTWLLALVFGSNALLIGNLVPNARVSVEITSAALAWALAIGTTTAGVLLVLVACLDARTAGGPVGSK